MLITKFNKLIRSKIVWTVFAFMIAFFFVGAGVTDRSNRPSDEDRGIEGRLFGEKIKANEFGVAQFFERGIMQRTPVSTEDYAALRKKTWMRLAILNLAGQLHLTATEDEIAEVIQRDPAFAPNGTFDRARYNTILQEHLRMRPSDYDLYLKQEITLKKMVDTVASLVWTPAEEMAEQVREFTDVMAAEYVLVSNDVSVAATDVSEDIARDFFEAHRDLFAIPERTRVRFVAFPISNYLAQAAEVDETAIVDYYNDHIDDYTDVDTNDVATTQPLEDVRAGIAAVLTRQEAVTAAENAATEFAMKLATDRFGRALPMDQTASSMGLTIVTSELFAADETVPGVDAGMDFTRVALSLDPGDPDAYFSDAVRGEEHIYIIATHDKEEARDPEFEEVREDVLPLAAEDLKVQRFTEELEKVRTSLVDAMGETQTFAQAAASLSLNISTTQLFSVYEGMATVDGYQQSVARAVSSLQAGEVSEPLSFGDAGAIAHLVTRAPGDLATVQMIRPQLLRMLNDYRANILALAWGEALLQEAGLDDARPPLEADEE